MNRDRFSIVIYRPALFCALVVIIGAFLFLSLPPSGIVITALVAVGLLTVGFAVLFCMKRKIPYLLFLIVLLAIFIPVLHWVSTEYVSLELVSSLGGNPVVFTGQVLAAKGGDRYTTFDLLIETADGVSLNHAQKARYTAFSEEYAEQGERFRLVGIAESARDIRANDFDTAGYLRSQGIFIQITGKEPIAVEIASDKQQSVFQPVRDYVHTVLYRYLPQRFDYVPSQIASALLLGDKQEMPQDVKTSFRRSGISHLVSVSGFHVAVFLGFLTVLLVKLTIGRKTRIALLAIFAVLFMGCAGFSVSIVRATIMVFTVYLGILLGRKADSLSALGLAAILIVVINPYSVFDVGAQLSFLATFGILASSPLREWVAQKTERFGMVSALLEVAMITAAAVVFTLPVSMNSFGETSLISVLCNLVVVQPACAVLILLFVLLALAAPPVAAQAVVLPGGFLLSAFETLSEWLAFAIRVLLYFIRDAAQFFSAFRYASVSTTVAYPVIFVLLAEIVLFTGYLIFQKSRLKLQQIIGIFLIAGVVLSASLIYTAAQDRNTVISFYRENADHQAIAVKLGLSGSLIVVFGDQLCMDADQLNFDAYDGRNHLLLVRDENHLDTAALLDSLSVFRARYGIERVYIAADPSGEENGIAEWKDRLEQNGYSAETVNRNLTLDEFRIDMTKLEKSRVFRLQYRDWRMTVLYGRKYDREIFEDGPDVAVYLPMQNGTLFRPAEDQLPSKSLTFYTRISASAEQRKALSELQNHTEVNVIPLENKKKQILLE